MKNAIIILAAGLLLFELIEHVIFPLSWFIKDRKRKSVCGVTGMIGKIGEVKYWQEYEGQLFVNGELWNAISDFPFSPGDRVAIHAVDGLMVKVIPLNDRGE